MTKTILFVIVIFSLGLVSCKKEYQCDCVTTKTNNSSGEPATMQSTTTYKYFTKTRGDARNSCINDHNEQSPGLRTECDIQ